MDSYRVCIQGEITDVYLSFFRGMVVHRDEKVADTHFVTFANGSSCMTFSIYYKEYERAMSDLRDSRIEEILK